MSPAIIAILTLGSLCGSTGTVFLKLGATGRTTLLSFLNVQIIAGLALYSLGAAFWIFGMSRQSLTSVYPFTMLSFIIIYMFGIFFFGEAPSRSGVCGVVLMLIGLYFVTRNAA